MSVSTREGSPTNPKQNPADRPFCDDSIQMEVFDSFDRVDAMQSQWDEFIESLGYDIFTTFDWCRIWWKHYGGGKTLRIFVFRHRESLVGLLPMYLEKIRIGPVAVKVARIVGTPCTPVEVNPPVSEAFMHQVVGLWLERLYSESKPDIVYIGPISGTYDITDQLAGELAAWANHRCVTEKREIGVQTIFRLGADWDEYFAGLSKKERFDVSRNYNNIVKVVHDNNAQIVSEFVSESGLSDAFNDFIRMHNVHWQQLGQAGHFNDWPNSEEFHREVAEAQLRHGRLRLLKVCVGSSCVGYEYAYKFSRTYFQFLNARTSSTDFDRISVGKLNFCELVKKAVSEGANLINSMRGRYEYKLRLGGKLLPVKALYVVSGTVSARLKVLFLHAFAYIINLCYYRVWYLRIAPRFSLNRKHLWKLWIRTSAFAGCGLARKSAVGWVIVR